MNWFKKLLGLNPSTSTSPRPLKALRGGIVDRDEEFQRLRERLIATDRLLTAPIVEPVRPIRQKRLADPFQFLGHGVSSRLREDDGEIERIREFKLPEWRTPRDVADGLGITTRQLHWLAYFRSSVRSTHYVYFEIEKSSGGTRTLSAPRPLMAACQRVIKSEILDRLQTHEAAHGFVPGRSILTSASCHVGREIVVNMDLRDFFPSIGFVRVRGWFQSHGYCSRVSSLLALLCTDVIRSPRIDSVGATVWDSGEGETPSLPQGACTSPAISNLICSSFDRRVSGLATKLGWTWTRYADDLTFSANHPESEGVGYLMHRIRGLAAESGFKISEGKTRVQRRHQRQNVTGLTVNDRVSVNRKTRRRVRAILHQAKMSGLSAQNRDNHPDFAQYLRGLIAHIAYTNPELGAKLAAQLDEITHGT